MDAGPMITGVTTRRLLIIRSVIETQIEFVSYRKHKHNKRCMVFPRASGILLHPTSLPGKFGIGDLGDEAYAFVDFLVASKQSLWQALPLGPTGYGDSPYQCFSAFAGNTLLVSPERLLQEGLLRAEDLQGTPQFPEEKIDFGNVIKFKNALLEKAFARFLQTTDTNLRTA